MSHRLGVTAIFFLNLLSSSLQDKLLLWDSPEENTLLFIPRFPPCVIFSSQSSNATLMAWKSFWKLQRISQKPAWLCDISCLCSPTKQSNSHQQQRKHTKKLTVAFNKILYYRIVSILKHCVCLSGSSFYRFSWRPAILTSIVDVLALPHLWIKLPSYPHPHQHLLSTASWWYLFWIGWDVIPKLILHLCPWWLRMLNTFSSIFCPFVM